ncbi:MAG: hypothetical protein KA004_06420 [Verrucomicrobiales bacterium]|nr:hypothetical protein [Verrucomicrobiales bacterium]
MNANRTLLAAGMLLVIGAPGAFTAAAQNIAEGIGAGIAVAIERKPVPGPVIFLPENGRVRAARQAGAEDGLVIVGAGPKPKPFKRDNLPFDAAGGHLLELVDGSMLHGTVESISATEVVVKRSDASAPIILPVGMLSRIVFDNAGDPQAAPPHSTVQFRSGDWMAADVPLLKDGKAEVRIGTRRMTIDQSKIDWISFSEGKAPDVFVGPDSLDGWTTGAPWSLKDGVLLTRKIGNIGRNFTAVPDRIDMQWEMAPGEVQRNFMFSFNYSRHGPQGIVGNAWTQVRFNEGQLYLYTATQNKNRNFSIDLPRVAIRKAEDGKMHYRVVHDRTGGRLAVFVNGRKITDQKVPPMAAGNWSGMMNFQPMRWSSDAQWEISKIRMQPWDGWMPSDRAPDAPNRLDLLSLADGTVKPGRIESLLGGVLNFKSATGLEAIPRSRMAMLRLRKAAEAPAPEAASGPRLLLADRGEWKLLSLLLKDGVFQLSTGFAGEISLPNAAVHALVFSNPVPDKIEPADRLVFKNGDQLRGELEGAGTGQPVGWKLPNGSRIQFGTKRLGGILLTGRDGAPQAAETDMVLRFRNGDWLGGSLVGIDRQGIKFQTAFAREITVERPRVQSLYLSKPGERPVWEGADDPEGWWKGTFGPNQGWFSSGGEPPTGPRASIYLDGSYLLPGQNGNQSGIGRLLENLPERVEVSFEAAAERGAPAFSLQLFYAKQGNTGLMVQIWQGGMYVYDMEPQPKGGRGMWGNQPVQVQWKDKVNPNARKHVFRIFADRKARRAAFFVDGVQVAQFTRRGPKAEKESEASPWGTGISLHPQNANQLMIFSNLWISPWNGQMPSTAQKEPVETVSLANGDEAMAEVVSATARNFQLRFEGEPLELPRERIVMIDFGGVKNLEPKVPAVAEPAGEVQPAAEPSPALRLRFAKGGTICVEAMRIENGEVVCSSPNFGELKLPLASFREIVWNRLDSLIDEAPPSRPSRRAEK